MSVDCAMWIQGITINGQTLHQLWQWNSKSGLTRFHERLLQAARSQSGRWCVEILLLLLSLS